MQFLFTQLYGLNLLKDILIPFLAAGGGFWLASMKFKKEHLWQEKYSAYREILGAIEEMAYWADEASNETVMLPLIGWFDGKSSNDFYAQARRQISKHIGIDRLLISCEAVVTLEKFQTEIFQEYYRADEERSHNPHEEESEFGFHAREVQKITAKYLPHLTVLARNDLGLKAFQ